MVYGRHSIFANKAMKFRYVRFTVLARRETDNHLQLSELRLYDKSKNLVSWPQNATVAAKVGDVDFYPVSGVPGEIGNYPTSEGPEKIIDNTLSTKFCGTCKNVFPVVFTIDCISPDFFDLKTIAYYRYYTANDSPGRDPVSFTLSASADLNRWVLLDSATNVDVTTSRQAMAYEGSVAKRKINGGGWV